MPKRSATNELAPQLLESSKTPQIIQPVQLILADDQNRRRAFYEWMDEDKEAGFIDGAVVVHLPALREVKFEG